MNKLTLTLLFMAFALYANAQTTTIDLSGQWMLGEDCIYLPGTTDTNRKGERNNRKDETTHLSRHFTWFGEAVYTKNIDIPSGWKGKKITLFLERTKPTTIYIDGKEVGKCDDISVPQVYDLTGKINPGRHVLSIAVDNGNSVPKQLLGSSHAYTEDTQTNWNGIIGKMYLKAHECPVTIKNVRTHSQAKENRVDIEVTLNDARKKKYIVETLINGRLNSGSVDRRIADIKKRTDNVDGTTTLLYSCHLGDDAMKWSEFTPQNLYKLTVRVVCNGKSDECSSTFALCDFDAKGNHFEVNGRKTFLRGKHDACVFPLTGHVPMDRQQWYRYLSICKQYGINHVRFHSWCPPEACFDVADELGIYLQPELPIWGGFDENDQWLTTYLRDEGRKIIETYGNHPSFVMMGLGNELWGSIELMADYVEDFRRHDDIGNGCRRLYTFGSNMYLGYKGVLDGMDYFTTCRIGGEAWGRYDTHVRGSFSFADAADGGLINHEYPNSITNFEKAIEGSKVPIISHETGQFQTYPDYDEISKYTGVLYPDNMIEFKNRLAKAGMANQAADFHEASGKWSVELYKADIEMDLRTNNMAGFQLLDIQDYPGQGSAYVGILDAFMDTKGIVQSSRWRQWCNDVVPLAELPRYTYNDGDTIRWNILIANYSENDEQLKGKTMKWTISSSQHLMAKGNLIVEKAEAGLMRINQDVVVAHLSETHKAERLTLRLEIEGTPYANEYPIWIYPSPGVAQNKYERDILFVDSLDENVVRKLEKGSKVLLMPRKDMYREQTVGGLTQTDYWNYRMFKTISENNKKPVSPGTLGLLINDEHHPLFDNFPTRKHTEWQWAPLAHEARPLIMDAMPEGYAPLVQVIDNVERNHRLGIIFELAVGKGKLMVCMCDLKAQDTPESRQLLTSMMEYMRSGLFTPKDSISAAELMMLFETNKREKEVKELRNISYD